MANNGINVADCRVRAHDGAKVMRDEILGITTFIKKQQPLTEYTHCKNKSIQKFMDNITAVCYFVDKSPKRQQCFKLLLKFHGEKLQLNETKWRDIIGLSKTR